MFTPNKYIASPPPPQKKQQQGTNNETQTEFQPHDQARRGLLVAISDTLQDGTGGGEGTVTLD